MHEARTADEQMTLVRQRPGNSIKERERLIVQKEARHTVAKLPPVGLHNGE